MKFCPRTVCAEIGGALIGYCGMYFYEMSLDSFNFGRTFTLGRCYWDSAWIWYGKRRFVQSLGMGCGKVADALLDIHGACMSAF